MQFITEYTLLFVIIIIIFSIVLIWWSSNLMISRGRVRGGVHVMLMGCVLAYNAGVVFYGFNGGRSAVAMVVISFLLTAFSWFFELNLRKTERQTAIKP